MTTKIGKKEESKEMTRSSRKESNYTTTREMPAMKGAKEMARVKGTNKEMPAMTKNKRKESNHTTTNRTWQGEERRLKL